MKILHVCTSDRGGAAIAAVRLHKAMLNLGIDSNILFLKRFDNSIPKSFIHNSSNFLNKKYFLLNRAKLEFKLFFDKFRLRKRRLKFELFTWSHSFFDLTKNECYKTADIINLHWVANFINYDSFFLKNNKPVFWTLHDQNPFTGGCHYSFGCKKFQESCNTCPQLLGINNPSISSVILSKKKSGIINKQNSVFIIALSKWMLSLSTTSVVFQGLPHTIISNSLEGFNYKPKIEARVTLGITTNKVVFLFVAHEISNPRKGFNLLEEALASMNKKSEILLMIIGNSTEIFIQDIEFINFGFIRNAEDLNNIYSAADALVVPSLEDNFPNTVLEALCCGTPVIGFDVGGISDMIQNGTNGFLVDKIEAFLLSDRLNLIIDEGIKFDFKKISEDARAKYSPITQAQTYYSTYQKLQC
jgi:glycosyltransferase involved in cell wall biosynthesis